MKKDLKKLLNLAAEVSVSLRAKGLVKPLTHDADGTPLDTPIPSLYQELEAAILSMRAKYG